MAIFGKKHDAQPPAAPGRDPGKAKRFFDHAKVVAASRNYDYAIECYINGLRHDPGNMEVHEALRSVALKRKLGGGKPARLTEKFKSAGKESVDRLLHTEMLWSKDPQDISIMVDLMSRAIEADQVQPDLNLAQLAHWVGRIALEANQAAKKPRKSVYIKVRDLFHQLQAFSDAVQACQLALRLDPDNTALATNLKDLDAEMAMQEGGFTTENMAAGGFIARVKDMDKQRQLETGEALTPTASALEREVQRLRRQHQDTPQDIDLGVKLVNALVRLESETADQEAIELLERAADQTGQYRYHMQIGDIRMKQMSRRIRATEARLKEEPNDSAARRQLRMLAQKKLALELDQFTQRVKHYPTDLGLRYELGRRLYATNRIDEAIGAFQQAKADPKHRVASLEYLGRCYLARGWLEESIDALRQGVEAHPHAEDRMGLELRYRLLLSLKKLAAQERSIERAREVQKIASQILQTDINFRDIRQQMDEARQLVEDLAKSG